VIGPAILAISVLAEMAVAALWLFRSRRILPLTLLLVGSVVWIMVNGPIEGPVLWVLTPGHGLTAADLLSPIGVSVGAAGWWWPRPAAARRRRTH